MTDADGERYAKAMAVLNMVFAPALNEAQQVAYFMALRSEVTIEQLEDAVQRVMRTRRYPTPPLPAELIAAAKPPAEERAVLAWARAINASRQGYGGYTPITFHDPILHATVAAMGGWSRFYSLGFRDTEPVDVATARKEFLQLYPIMATRGTPENTPATLCAERGHDHLAARVVPALVPETAPRAFPIEPPVEVVDPIPEVRKLIDTVAERMTARLDVP